AVKPPRCNTFSLRCSSKESQSRSLWRSLGRPPGLCSIAMRRPDRDSGLAIVFRVAFGLTQNQLRHGTVRVKTELHSRARRLESRFRLWDQRKGIQVQCAVDLADGLIGAHETCYRCRTFAKLVGALIPFEAD